MSIFNLLAKATIATTLVAVSATASAALIPFTSPTLFTQAVYQPGIDTFSSLPLAAIPAPYSGMAGPYAYTAGTSGSGSLYGSGSPGDPWLSTDLSGDSIVFTGFAPNVRAIGGFFFGSDVAGAFLPGQSLTVSVVDALGATAMQTLLNATELSFAGFTSNAAIVSMTVTIASLGAFATVDDLRLAQVPEPATIALLFAGVGAVLLGRRRNGGAAPAALAA